LKTPKRIDLTDKQMAALLSATVYEMERLRCSLCGKVFTAETPEGTGDEKYDSGAGAMVALLKYGSGMSFYRLEGLQDSLGYRYLHLSSGR
jgi:transposase